MKKLLILFCLIALNCFSQTGTIQGNIFDTKQERKAAYVGVRLTQQQKDKIKLLTYVQADSLGNFKFENVKIGEYALIIESIAFKETKNNIKVSENVTTYLNLIVNGFCAYEDLKIDQKTEEIILIPCPICHKNEDVVIIQYATPHYAVFLKGKTPKGYYSEKRFYDRYNSEKNVYEICSPGEKDCKPHYYCKKDKVKF